MKSIKYFIQFIVIIFFFLIFKIFGFKLSSNISSKTLKILGPFFRSKKLIQKNILKALPNLDNKEIEKTIEEYTQFMNMKINESNSSFVTEAGEVEKWDGGINKERAEEALREGIEYLKGLKKD